MVCNIFNYNTKLKIKKIVNIGNILPRKRREVKQTEKI